MIHFFFQGCCCCCCCSFFFFFCVMCNSRRHPPPHDSPGAERLQPPPRIRSRFSACPNRSMVASVGSFWSRESMDFVVWWSLLYGVPCVGRGTLVCLLCSCSLLLRMWRVGVLENSVGVGVCAVYSCVGRNICRVVGSISLIVHHLIVFFGFVWNNGRFLGNN